MHELICKLRHVPVHEQRYDGGKLDVCGVQMSKVAQACNQHRTGPQLSVSGHAGSQRGVANGRNLCNVKCLNPLYESRQKLGVFIAVEVPARWRGGRCGKYRP